VEVLLTRFLRYLSNSLNLLLDSLWRFVAKSSSFATLRIYCGMLLQACFRLASGIALLFRALPQRFPGP
jgi:hypothetical protein